MNGFNPARFFVSRWQFTLVLSLLLTLLGLNAFFAIPRSEDPHFASAFVTVRAVMPGATPIDMEQQVAKPIEDAIDTLDDVKEIRTVITDGSASVRVEFDWDTDSDRKYDEVVREANGLRPILPRGLTRLDIQRGRPTEVSVFQVALVSDHMPMRHLEKVADDLREAVKRVPGIRDARYWGAPPSEMRVSLDLGRLASLRLPASAVVDALTRAGGEAPIGAVEAGNRRLTVRQGGAFSSIDAVAMVPVTSRGGQVLRVRDLADVAWAETEPQHITRFNGKRAVLVTANQKDGEDVSAITKGIKDTLDRFERTLPGGVKLERAFFQMENVDHRLDKLTRDFLLALLIVSITLLPLGLRAAGVVLISIPLSLLVGLVIIHALGFGLNQLSIAGFVLSLGLLVDDSIVVTENIARRLREGEDRITAAVAGTGQIALAVVGCTACLMLAFLPLMMLPEGSGVFIRSLPVTVLATVGASFVIALTLMPFFASRFLNANEAPEGNRLLQAVHHGIHVIYRPLLHRSLERPWRALIAVMALCLLSVPIIGAIGTSLFPAAETPQFLVRIETPEGTTMNRTDAALRFAERRLARDPAVKWYAANLGRGNPQLYYNVMQSDPASNFAEIGAALKAWEGQQSEAVIERLRTDLAAYAGAKISVLTFEQGVMVEAPIVIRITGPELPVLKDMARKTEQTLQRVEGVRDIGNPLRIDRTDLTLGVDEGRAATMGVGAGAARQAVRLALTGEQAARFRDGDGDDYPVTIRSPMDAHNLLGSLDRIYVPASDGDAVPLSALAKPGTEGGPARIDRFNRERAVLLTAHVRPGFLTSDVTARAQSEVERAVALPPGYQLSLGGEAEARERSFAGLGAAIIIAILGILCVLVLEFGRFRSVAVVAGIIPLGVLGAVFALLVSGQSLSFTAMIGIVALIGIEIKNSILLVDFTEQLRAEGMGIRDAIEHAGEVRFLPVLLTSVTAIGGLLPLALEGSGLYAPMAIAIIGGLVSSTLLSRIATPVMYLLLAKNDEGRAA